VDVADTEPQLYLIKGGVTTDFFHWHQSFDLNISYLSGFLQVVRITTQNVENIEPKVREAELQMGIRQVQ
jgi:hypothetical protein